MKQKNIHPSTNSSILHQKVEESLKRKSSKMVQQLSEAETIKLLYELEVHQEELKLQNEELKLAVKAAQDAIEQYDLAPSGFFSLSGEGEIIKLNLRGAKMLGKERSRLIHNRFDFFVSEDTKPIFTHFLENVFRSQVNESCELILTIQNCSPIFVHLSAIATPNREHCQVTAIDITKYKQAELDLKESEIKYRELVENSPDAIAIYRDGKIVFVNKECLLLTGAASAEELIGKSVIQFIHPDYRALVIERMKKAVKEGTVQPLTEEKFVRSDGSEVDVEVKAMPINFDHKPAVQLIIRNITSRKQMEAALHESEVRHRILFENSPDAYLIIIDGIFTACNRATEIMLGGERTRIIGHPPDILSPEFQPDGTKSAESAQEKIKKALETGSNTFEWVHRRFDGTDFLVEVSIASMMLDEKPALFTTWRDITRRKQSEEELRDSEQRLKYVLQGSQLGFWDWNLETNEIKRNERWAEMLGYQLHELDFTNKQWIDFIHPEDQTTTLQSIQNHIEGLTSNHSHEFRMLTKDGQYKWILDQAQSVKWDSNGRSIRISGTHKDITSRKIAEQEINLKNEELLKLNAEKDKFFSIIAHDLRSPFSSFLGLTQIMAEESSELTMEAIQDIALSMKNSATNLFNLLENLLHWARIQQGLIPFRPEVVQIQSIVNQITATMEESAKNKGIGFEYHIPENMEVFADSYMLQTVIRNLVSNALKFTPKGGKITVSARSTSDHSVEISLRDNGMGMNREMLENLFRLDVNTSRLGIQGEPSTGLGLILCKDFIERHGGQLWVESEEGKGSVFYFTIP
ncbi:MAG: PAS domain S-box protein [Bacteroidota bacterium]|nr:PAS domain S-box protein [Bacteroidota bacterium]